MLKRTRGRYERGVAETARVLDGDRPGWHHRVSLWSLDVGSRECCVLGQVYGSYEGGRSRLRDRMSIRLMLRSVYVPPWRQPFVDELWEREITTRRLASAEDQLRESV